MIDPLITRGDALFKDKSSLNSLWQEIADNFYPERSDFTISRYLGSDFASGLTSSYPIIVRRELGNAFSSILRPSELEWFEITVEDDESLDLDSKEWLQRATRTQRRAMYDRQSNFVRAAKEGDHDFAAFGQCVLSVEYDPRSVTLLYRTWHLRDCAWSEQANGDIGEIHINWKPRVRELKEWFGKDKLHQTVADVCEKEPENRIACRRIVVKAEDYQDGKKHRHPWLLIYVDLENKHVMQTIEMRTRGHVIPRWQTVSGSQYAFSPATIAGLPDARLIQAMTLTLLEAGEMAVHPPYVLSGDHFREDINNFAGGLTYVTGEYDKRQVDLIRRLNEGNEGLPFGMDFQADIREMLAAAFFLNKISLPPSDGKEMTAYETSERVKEYIRTARPLFEPAEYEYNHGLCEATFEELLPRGAFGSIDEMPRGLQGREVRFKFESPLHSAVERQKAVTFMEAGQLVQGAMAFDQSTGQVVDFHTALRDALDGVKTPAKWYRSEEQVEEMARQQAAEQAMREQVAMIEQGGTAAEQLGKASQALG